MFFMEPIIKVDAWFDIAEPFRYNIIVLFLYHKCGQISSSIGNILFMSASAQLYCYNLSITQCYDTPKATYCMAFSRELLNMKKNKKSLQLKHFFFLMHEPADKNYMLWSSRLCIIIKWKKEKRLKKNQI